MYLPKESADFNAEERSNRLLFYRLTRTPIVLLVAWWTYSMVLAGNDWIFLDGVNWFIHELGHALFSFGTPGLHAFGGTLLQALFPAACAAYFIFKKDDWFGGIVCTWWVGENFRNIARYLGDAAFERLPITGEIHDWAFLARRWHFLSSAQEIASVLRGLGALLMVASLGYLAFRLCRPTEDAVNNVLAPED